MWKLKYACSCIEGYKTWSVKLVGEIKSEKVCGNSVYEV
jgi:hypothetical protein